MLTDQNQAAPVAQEPCRFPGCQFTGCPDSGCYASAPAAPVAQPLTDEQIAEAVREAGLDWHNGWSLDETEPNRFVAFARAIEHAHGIGQEGGAA